MNLDQIDNIIDGLARELMALFHPNPQMLNLTNLKMTSSQRLMDNIKFDPYN